MSTLPKQFSCWNAGDPNLKVIAAADLMSKLESDIALKACQIAARKVLMGGDDITSGSTHFHGKHISPAWAKDKTPVLETRAHRYYNNVA